MNSRSETTKTLYLELDFSDSDVLHASMQSVISLGIGGDNNIVGYEGRTSLYCKS